MTLRYSTGLRNHLAAGGSFKRAFQNGKIEIYTGSQPASADAAVTGTLLCTITAASGAHTAEVKATGTITLAGASGSVDTLTLDGYPLIDAAVPFNTDLTTTAADLASKINDYENIFGVTATSSGAIVTIYAPVGAGTQLNSMVIGHTETTLTVTPANPSGGVAPVNGLKFGSESAGAIAKLASQTWSGTNVAGGTAGYYRMYGSVSDAGGADSTGTKIREDGAISTSGQQLNFSGSTTLTDTATTTITAWTRTVPSS